MLSYDLILRIIKCLPLKDQYNLVITIGLFQGSERNKYIDNFIKDKIYVIEIISRIYDDIPSSAILKYKTPFKSKNIWNIKFNTQINNLPFGFDHNKAIHKIPVWNQLYLKNHVGKYALQLDQYFNTRYETFDVKIHIIYEHGSLFKISIQAIVFVRKTRELIMSGSRQSHIDFSDLSNPLCSNVYLYPESGTFFTIQNSYPFEKCIKWLDQATIFYNNLPGFNCKKYRIGFSKEQILRLLF